MTAVIRKSSLKSVLFTVESSPDGMIEITNTVDADAGSYNIIIDCSFENEALTQTNNVEVTLSLSLKATAIAPTDELESIEEEAKTIEDEIIEEVIEVAEEIGTEFYGYVEDSLEKKKPKKVDFINIDNVGFSG